MPSNQSSTKQLKKSYKVINSAPLYKTDLNNYGALTHVGLPTKTSGEIFVGRYLPSPLPENNMAFPNNPVIQVGGFNNGEKPLYVLPQDVVILPPITKTSQTIFNNLDGNYGVIERCIGLKDFM